MTVCSEERIQIETFLAKYCYLGYERISRDCLPHAIHYMIFILFANGSDIRSRYPTCDQFPVLTTCDERWQQGSGYCAIVSSVRHTGNWSHSLETRNDTSFSNDFPSLKIDEPGVYLVVIYTRTMWTPAYYLYLVGYA